MSFIQRCSTLAICILVVGGSLSVVADQRQSCEVPGTAREDSPQGGLVNARTEPATVEPTTADSAAEPAEVEPDAESASEQVDFVLRSRSGGFPGTEACVVSHDTVTFDMSKTLIVVIDMWEEHWCERMTASVAQLGPKINRFNAAARERGATIVHCPYGSIDQFGDHPAVRNANAITPTEIAPNGFSIIRRNRQIESELYPMITDITPLGGCRCERRCRGSICFRQTDAIEVHESDYLTQSGNVLMSLLLEKEIEHILYTGVAIERCVLGRPFGMRSMISCGFETHMVRDLVDGMHLFPWMKEMPQSVSNQISLEHVERFIAPTVISASLLDNENQESISRSAEDNAPSPRFAMVQSSRRRSVHTFNLYHQVGTTTYECIVTKDQSGSGEQTIDLSSMLEEIDRELEIQAVQVLRDGYLIESSIDLTGAPEVRFHSETAAPNTLIRITLEGEQTE